MESKFRVITETESGREEVCFCDLAEAITLFLTKYNEDNDARIILMRDVPPVSSESVSTTVYASGGNKGPKVVRHEKLQPRLKIEGVGDPACPLYDKHVRISGTFDQIGKSRDEILDAIQQLGAKYACTDIIKGMDVVVFGNNYGPSKEKKVRQWQSEGRQIRIISQFELKDIFEKYLPKE